MTLRARALLILGLTILGLLTALHFSLRVMLQESFLEAEHRDVERKLTLVHNALSADLENLDGVVADWATWDDTYRFVLDRNAAYREGNLVPSAFTTTHNHALLIADQAGEWVWAGQYDFEAEALVPLAGEIAELLRSRPELLHHPDEHSAHAGFIALGGEAILFSSRPVLRGDFSGPPRGAFVMVRRLDAAALQRLSARMDVEIAVVPLVGPADVRIEVVDEYRVAGALPIADLTAPPSLALRVEMPREIYQQGRKSLSYLLFSVLLAGGLFLLAVWAIIDRMVLLRLSNLADAIRQIRSSDDLSRRVAVSGRDELSLVEQEINGMMGALEISERRLRHQAYHDPLTDLPNRTLFYRNLGADLEAAERRRRMVAVMFLDLDRFKAVNDMLGHSIGDRLLRDVAARLRRCVGRPEAVSRLGGDEFTVVLPDLETPAGADEMARAILKAFEEPFELDGRRLYVNTSIGISVYPYDGTTVETLIQNADAALYHMKDKGRNHYWFYSSDISAMLSRRALLEGSLRKALEQEEFVLHYQPQVDVSSGEIIGMEALLRWRRGEEMVPPGEFIGVLEETGLIVAADQWVMRTACRQNKAWQDAGLRALPVSVNVSALLFQRPTLIETVTRILEETGLPPEYLCMEITESLAMLNVEMLIDKLVDLQALGVRIQIDDFGTGYSSLSYLKKFPISTLKIDRSFVRDIAVDSDDADIVASIIAMAQKLRIDVLAEGVETVEQAQILWGLGCAEMQGYLFSRPVPAEELARFLKGHRIALSVSASPAQRASTHLGVVTS